MIVRFKKLYIHNFLSIGDAEIDLENDGYVIIRGMNESEDNAKSNGSGKSSIWCAFTWVLTGETIRGTKDVVNNKATDGAWVKIEFTVDDKSFVILRAKNSETYGNDLKIWTDDKDVSGKGIRDTTKKLAQYLPDLTTELIGSVIILGQGLPQRFTNNTPSGRKEVLEKLSKSDYMIEDLKKRVSVRKVKKEAEKLQCTQETAELTGKYTANREQITSMQSELDALSDIEEIKEVQVELQQSKENCEEQLAQCNELLKQLNGQLEDYREDYRNIIDRESATLLQIQQEYTETSQPFNVQQSEIKAQLCAKESELKRLREIKDVCPTCGQHINGVVKPDTSLLEAEILDLRHDLNESNKHLSEMETLLKSRKNGAVSDFKVRREDITAQANMLKKRIAEAEIKYNELSCKLDNTCKELSEMQIKLLSHKSVKESLIKKIEESKIVSAKLMEKITALHCKNGLIQQCIDILSKFETILKRDFRGILLSNVITYLNDKVREYANYMFGSPCVSVELEGNAINVTFNGRQYENLSGGERQKIDVMVQFAIRDMLCTHLNFSSNILVVDEVFDGLDTIGCQQIVDLLSCELQDVESVFIISHHTDITIPYDKEITVVKDREGISHIR